MNKFRTEEELIEYYEMKANDHCEANDYCEAMIEEEEEEEIMFSDIQQTKSK